MRELCGAQAGEMAEVFAQWNFGKLSSYLVEITAAVLRKPDDQGPGFLVDAILDKAGQKGTGVWTAKEALDLGVATPTIGAAVEARILSSLKTERVEFEKAWSAGRDVQPSRIPEDLAAWENDLASALYAAKILCYAQGFDLIARASTEYAWNIDCATLARIWKGGCIIRARFLDEIARAYERNPRLSNLMFDPSLLLALQQGESCMRRMLGKAVAQGVPLIAFSSALAYLDSFKLSRLPQNLTQAQRDFFGAHTFERLDRPGNFHAQWVE